MGLHGVATGQQQGWGLLAVHGRAEGGWEGGRAERGTLEPAFSHGCL